MFLLQWSIIGKTYNREFGFAKKVYNHTRCLEISSYKSRLKSQSKYSIKAEPHN